MSAFPCPVLLLKGSSVDKVIKQALKLSTAREVILARTAAELFPRPQKTILTGNLIFTLGEQETGIVRMEVAVLPKEVERLTQRNRQ